MENLPQMTKAEISQSMLKYANLSEKEKFAQSVLILVNPKFENEDEGKLAFGVLIDFCHTSDLTADEMILAIKMAMDRKLYIDSENGMKPVQVFREIDRLKLGEIQHAYKEFKRANSPHQKAKEEIKKLLAFPPVEISEEQKKAERMKFYEEEWKRLQDRGIIYGTIVFYELIKTEVEKVKLSFLEAVLDTYKPENKKGIIEEIVQQNPKVHFINHFVMKFIKAHKLKALSLEDWKLYWEEKHKKRKQK